MKKLLLFLSLIIFANVVRADIPRPEKTPQPEKQETRVNFDIASSSQFNEATLVIPRGALNNLRAQLDEIEGTDSNSSRVSGISGTQTLMSGLFFSAALIFGGVWMFRGKSLAKNQKIVAGLLIFAFLGASVYTVSANVAPPVYQSLNNSIFSDKMKNERRVASGKVKISIVDSPSENTPMKLYIPRNDGATENNGEE